MSKTVMSFSRHDVYFEVKILKSAFFFSKGNFIKSIFFSTFYPQFFGFIVPSHVDQGSLLAFPASII
jgi:hypothetical protein